MSTTARQIAIIFTSMCFQYAYAEESNWKINTSALALNGQYKNSSNMDSQTGIELRMNAEHQDQWGFTAGVLSTRTQMANPLYGARQNQNNWLLSTHLHHPSNFALGRWTFQIDTYQIQNNDTLSNSDGVKSVAPRVAWLSYTHPIKVELSHAASSYHNTPAVQQHSASFAIGFNNHKTWLEVHQNYIYGLNPIYAQGLDNTRASDIRLSQKIHDNTKQSIPNRITLDIETGRRIYNIDMKNQVVYNLPMLNRGSRSIAATWSINPTDTVTLRAGKTSYSTNLPNQNNFELINLSSQYSTSW